MLWSVVVLVVEVGYSLLKFFLLVLEEAEPVCPVFLAVSFLDVSVDLLHQSCELGLIE